MWKVAKSDRCGSKKPWAVVDDETGEVESCHATEREAQRRKSKLIETRKKAEATAKNGAMWPPLEELDDHTIAVEWALEKAYHLAIGNWLPTARKLMLPEVEGGADLPPDFDALVSEESLSAWNEQFDLWVKPAVTFIWSYSYMLAAHALMVDFFVANNPSITASGPKKKAPYEFPPWDDENDPPWMREGQKAGEYPKATRVQPDPEPTVYTDENGIYHGVSPSNAAANWTSDFDTWLAHLNQMHVLGPQLRAQRLERAMREHPEDFPESYRRYMPEPPPVDVPVLDAEVEADVVGGRRVLGPRGFPYGNRRQPDLVAEAVALAWKTKPEQMELAAKLLWDQVGSRRRLEMFLGSYSPQVGQSIPARMRDLLVGSTNRGSRKAIPLGELKEQLGVWLDTVNVIMPGGRDGDNWHRRGHPITRQNWESEADARIGTRIEDFYERDFEPIIERRPAMDMLQRFRDIARESGLEAAGIINQSVLTAASQSDVEFDKVWCAHMDTRTRPAHYAADGQRASVDGDFTVGGHKLDYPGDPSGPPELVRHCRCRIGITPPDVPLPREQQRNAAQRNEIIHRRRQGYIRAREDPNGIGYFPPDAQAVVAAAANEQENTMSDFRTFTNAVIAFVGSPTSDGRMLARGIELTVRNPPLPLMWMKQSVEGHDAAFTVGVIESAELTADGTVVASGYLLNSPEADEAADQLAHGVTRPSVDLASVEWITTDGEGNEVTEDNYTEGTAVFMTVTKAELIGTTLVATPAFGDTALPLNIDRESRDVSLVAAAAEDFRPRIYDHTLFENPKLDGPTLPTMDTASGRVYGHLACFGECHRSIQTECVMAPRSRTNYAHFHTSPAVRLDTGEFLPVGRLTVGTGHASASMSPRVAAAHYDNTGTCWALVRVGEDEHGIWFSGVAAPWATEAQIEMGLSSPLSGDWRDFGQGLELVAALAVNTPGFSIAQGRSDEQGRPVSLVASLGPLPDERIESLAASYNVVKDAVKEALIETRIEEEERRLAAEREALLSRANAMTRPPTPDEEVAELLARRK